MTAGLTGRAAQRRGVGALCVLLITPLDVMASSGKTQQQPQGLAEGLTFASLLEVFFCLSFGRNTRPSYASISAVTWSGSHLSLCLKPHCLKIFLP